MPTPSLNSQTSDSQAMSALLVTYKRRIEELERRTVQLGKRITIGDYVISAEGSRLIATRTSDNKVRTLADFAK